MCIKLNNITVDLMEANNKPFMSNFSVHLTIVQQAVAKGSSVWTASDRHNHEFTPKVYGSRYRNISRY